MSTINAQFSLGNYQTAVDEALKNMAQAQIIPRIWQHDHTVWRPDPAEITNRLGWLHGPETMQAHLEEMQSFAAQARADGLTHVLLLGMGGSSLAPEVFHRTFGETADGLTLAVVDTTDADAIRAYRDSLDLRKTLFIVATKSGGTVETLSAFKYFYNELMAEIGADKAGAHFVAITDPGSKLVALAEQFDFRRTFLNDPNIGGRYSVLSYFGLLPAILVGVDAAALLERATAVAANARAAGAANLSAKIGAAMGVLAKAGRDKLTFIISPAVASFGDWVEQLIAESTGKDGKGILPVVGEPVLSPDGYGEDRLFVYLQLDSDATDETAVAALRRAGQPVITVTLADLHDLGGHFFLWEMATAVAGHILNIQPFDQPNVESAKVQARKMVAAYKESGELPPAETSELSTENLHTFLAQARPGDYISIQAYVPPTPQTGQALQALRVQLLQQYRLATTVGYGPRFLHSTGQLHKGDSGHGLFIQFTSDAENDVAIPDEAGKPESEISFGVLKLAQALGDAQALRDEKRRLICFHLGTAVLDGLRRLVNS